MIGKTLGHYEITHKLGAGGMGVVYRARDTKLGREVALKLLPVEMLGDPAAASRLLEEARMASALNHPNICTIYEVGKDGDVTFAAMEYVEGRPLRAVVPAAGLPIELLIRYGAQMADAVSYAHAHGVIHRDLKTSNMMVTPEGRVKILDFGLARRVTSEAEQVTRSGTPQSALQVVGTLHYLSPELLRGETADARSDIWAMGVVLYEMAVGRLPFDAPSGFELSSKILRDPLPPPPHGVPASARSIIQRCLAKEPGQRYQHAGEIRAALETVSSDTATTVIRPEAAAKPKRPFPRKMVILAVLGIVAVVGLAIWKSPLWPGTEITQTGPRLSTGGKPSANAEANEYFERSQAILMASQRDLPRARKMVERALELDPKFADARAERGFMMYLEVDGGQSNDRSMLYQAEAELRRALQDDPNCGRAHSALAAVYLMQGRNELGRQEAEKALALNPDHPDADVWLMQYYRQNGDYETAFALARRSLQRNPLFWPMRMNLGEMLRQQGHYAEAQREQEKVLEQDPQSFYALRNLARIHIDTGNLPEARRALERARPEDRQNYSLRSMWAVLYALEGNRARALREMDAEVLKAIETGGVSPKDAAEFYAVLGNTEKALDWLDRAVRSGDEDDAWLRRDPLLANIRKHPRFQQILESIAFRRQQREKIPLKMALPD